MWEPTKHFSLLPVILIAQHDSTQPQPHPTSSSGQMAFFFKQSVSCTSTLNPWKEREERASGGHWAVWTNGFEVAEKIKWIKGNLFTDTPQTSMALLSRGPDKHRDGPLQFK